MRKYTEKGLPSFPIIPDMLGNNYCFFLAFVSSLPAVFWELCFLLQLILMPQAACMLMLDVPYVKGTFSSDDLLICTCKCQLILVGDVSDFSP